MNATIPVVKEALVLSDEKIHVFLYKLSSYNSKDMILHLSGWLTVLGLGITTSLFIMNYVNPAQGEGRIGFHCAVGKLTLVTTLIHIYVYPFNGFNSFTFDCFP